MSIQLTSHWRHQVTWLGLTQEGRDIKLAMCLEGETEYLLIALTANTKRFLSG